MSTGALTRLIRDRAAGRPSGLTSVCSAHSLVIEAALLDARNSGGPVLIEATCNQVNQEGGYTGMNPAQFRSLVMEIADKARLPRDLLILGGDHLGPNPWRHLPAEVAMQRAEDMVAAYASAGYEKLHLDCSMGCAGEPPALDDAVTAGRAARLAARAEQAAPGRSRYVIGTEVPTPGGSTDGLDHLVPTRAEAVKETWLVHREAFDALAPSAWGSVIAMVVQPGVEFGHEAVAHYRSERAKGLSAALDDLPGLVFEAHSTDYQTEAALARLVQDGFPILKVGPQLTFALRQALYGLDAIRAALSPTSPGLQDTMEALMLANPVHWQTHYMGTPDVQRILRHYSYSDRIRYYWPEHAAGDAVGVLLDNLGQQVIPETLVSQYLPRLYDRVVAGLVPADPRAMLLAAVRDVLQSYRRACRPPGDAD